MKFIMSFDEILYFTVNGLWKYALADGLFQMYCKGHSKRTCRHSFDSPKIIDSQQCHVVLWFCRMPRVTFANNASWLTEEWTGCRSIVTPHAAADLNFRRKNGKGSKDERMTIYRRKNDEGLRW